MTALRRSLILLFGVLCILGLAQPLSAQNFMNYGSSLYQEGGDVIGYATTVVDYGAALYYDVCVDAALAKNGEDVDSDYDCNNGQWAAEAYVAADANGGSTYVLDSQHSVAAYYQVYDWVLEFQGYYWIWFDPFDYYTILDLYYNLYLPGGGYADFYTFWWYCIYSGGFLEIAVYQWVYIPVGADWSYESASAQQILTVPIAITGISPPGDVPGSNGTLSISGSFTPSATSMSGAGGVSVSVISATETEVMASYSIAGGTEPGAVQLSLMSGALSSAVGFTVNPLPEQPPSISSSNPQGDIRGNSGTLSLQGSFTPADTTISVSGGAMSIGIDSITASGISASYSIDPGAPTGNRTITVSNSVGSATAGFVVGDPTPVITSMSPSVVEAWTVASVTITGSGFGSNPSVDVSPSFPVTITYKSDTQIQATFNLSEFDDGPYSVVVTSHGHGGNNFVSPPQGTQQNSNSANGTVLAGRPEIRMTYNGSPFTNGTAYISPTPAMPSLKAIMVRPNGSTLNYDNTSWWVRFWYQGSEPVSGQWISSPEKVLVLPSQGTISVAANQYFDITAALGGTFVGGYVTVNGRYHGREAEFVFDLKGQNPSPADIKNRPPTTISPMPWFFWKMAKEESDHTFQQFNTNPSVAGFPIYGFPDGWGLLQIDRQGEGYSTELPVIWNWISNVDAGGAKLVTKQSEMGNYWPNLLMTWHTYNNTHPPAPAANKVTGLNGTTCTFSMDFNGNPLNAGEHSFYDALWMKRYNGISGGGDYLYWKNTNLAPNESPHFDYHELNNYGKNYVEAVCGEPAP